MGHRRPDSHWEEGVTGWLVLNWTVQSSSPWADGLLSLGSGSALPISFLPVQQGDCSQALPPGSPSLRPILPSPLLGPQPSHLP